MEDGKKKKKPDKKKEINLSEDEARALFIFDASRIIQRVGATLGLNGSALMIASVFFSWYGINPRTFSPTHDILSKMDMLKYGMLASLAVSGFVFAMHLAIIIKKKFEILPASIAYLLTMVTFFFICYQAIPIFKFDPDSLQPGAGVFIYASGVALVCAGASMIYYFRDSTKEDRVLKKYGFDRWLFLKKKR
ncbi:MAG: hypothetical protein KAW12_01575 [Candidatus Aminicenantes bacterium]|nr:hypothetical protein [Candidatus Aminicenantes bacterium]